MLIKSSSLLHFSKMHHYCCWIYEPQSCFTFILFLLQSTVWKINKAGLYSTLASVEFGLQPCIRWMLMYYFFVCSVCVMCPGGTTGTGCGSLLQLPALRLSYCLHHHTVSYCQRQGVLWILLEGKRTPIHIFTHSNFFLHLKPLVWKGAIHNHLLWWPLLCCSTLLCCSVPLQLMRKVLGTHLGHSAIYTMCRIMEERY